MATLTWDSIVNILTRLDVKDLLRYRCVSKPWCSLIDGPDFIKMQLKHSMGTDSYLGLIRGQSELRSVDLDALDSAAVRLIPLTNDASRGIVILGRCNGLVAIGYSGMDMGIWNPSTRKLRKVPISGLVELPFPECAYRFGIVGFGYDPLNDDYKLLCNVHYVRKDVHSFYSEVKVFSVKTQTWKRLGDFPYKGHIRGNGLLAGTSLHWMVGTQLPTKSSIVVAAFDLVTEEYCEISLPGEESKKGMGFYTTMTELSGWLCVVSSYKKDQKVDHVDIWAMKEHGVKESWTKLFTVVPSDVTGVFNYVMPLAYLKSTDQVLLDQDGDKLLLDQDGDKLLFYDLERKRAESVKNISGVPKCSDMFVCVRSLLGVGGDDIGDNNGKKTGENKNENERKKQSGKKGDDFLSNGFKLVL